MHNYNLCSSSNVCQAERKNTIVSEVHKYFWSVIIYQELGSLINEHIFCFLYKCFTDIDGSIDGSGDL